MTLLLIIIVGTVLYNSYKQNKSEAPEEVLHKQESFIKDKGYLTEGDKNSQLHIVAFVDYRCAHCSDFHLNYKNTKLQKYIDNGSVKYTEILFPVIDKDSVKYTKMIRAINETGDIDYLKEYSNRAFESSTTDNNPIKTLKRTDIPEKDKNKILDTYKHHTPKNNKAEIKSELRISSTPTIFVNGDYVSDVEVLEDVIQQKMHE